VVDFNIGSLLLWTTVDLSTKTKSKNSSFYTVVKNYNRSPYPSAALLIEY
jgi:hypothetical protein